jgi:hypothetical protein
MNNLLEAVIKNYDGIDDIEVLCSEYESKFEHIGVSDFKGLLLRSIMLPEDLNDFETYLIENLVETAIENGYLKHCVFDDFDFIEMQYYCYRDDDEDEIDYRKYQIEQFKNLTGIEFEFIVE